MTERGRSDAQATALLQRTYATDREAQTLLAALAPDNAGFVRGRTDGATLVLEVVARGPAELRSTLEDALACLGAAERTLHTADASSRSGGGTDPRDASDDDPSAEDDLG